MFNNHAMTGPNITSKGSILSWRLTLSLLLLLLVPTAGRAQDQKAAVRRVLDDQVAAWNAGRLDEFMKTYWHAEELTFFSGARRLSGWEATLERYRQTYQAGGKEMGRLAFANLDIEPLGDAAALVRGEYRLKFSDGREASGIYTLVLRRFAAGWKIIHDHTSANQ